MKFVPTVGASAAITYDFAALTAQNAPTDVLSLDVPKHDASELIVGMRKRWRGGSGILQAYALANGKGELQTNAPLEIVEDASRIGGLPQVRNGVSCHACHVSGFNQLNTNALEDLLAEGVELFAQDEYKIDLEFLSGTQRLIERNNEDFAAAINYITGQTPEEFNTTFRAAYNGYRQPVTLEAAAKELRTTPDELRDAIALYSDQFDVTSGVAALAHDKPMSRDYYEGSYLELKTILEGFQSDD